MAATPDQLTRTDERESKVFGVNSKAAAWAAEMERLSHFSKKEALQLLTIYKRMKLKSELKMSRKVFMDVLHNTFRLNHSTLYDSLFRMYDMDKDGFIGPDDWVKGLSIALRGNLEEQAVFCHGVYVAGMTNAEGFLDREGIYFFLRGSIKTEDTDAGEEEVRDLCEIYLKKMDVNHDGHISLEDYVTAVKKDSLLLESLGQCFPSPQVKLGFLTELERMQISVFF